MTTKERIRAEIERRIKNIESCPFIQAEVGAYYRQEGKLMVYRDILSFLDTIEEEQRPEPYNPVYDEAYLNEKIAKATKSWEGVDVDAMLDECRWKEESIEGLDEAAREYATVCHKSRYYPPCDEAFKAGAEWQKAKMLEGAVEGFIFQSADYYPKQLIAGYDGELGMGDKVKVIIVKED